MDKEPECNISKILCPYCNAPWSEENVKLFDISSDYYESCGPFDYTASIKIKCHACKELLYVKEGVEDSYGL